MRSILRRTLHRIPLFVVAAFHAGLGVAQRPGFEFYSNAGWSIAFLVVAALIVATSIWWKNRYLRAFSLAASVTCLTGRGLVLGFTFHVWPLAIYAFMAAFLEHWAWLTMLPPIIDIRTVVLSAEQTAMQR